MDTATVADRAEAELTLGEVPDGMRFITAWADVQANRYELMRRGWGQRDESWILGVEKIEAETATDPLAWHRLLDALQRALPIADGSGRLMRPRGVGFDLGGAAGVTSRAYEVWLRWRKAGKARFLGEASHRHVWDVLPTQGTAGAKGLNTARLQVVYPEDVRADRKASSIAQGQVPVLRFNANMFKDDLATQLNTAELGPWYVHFPAALKDRAGPPHPWFEQLVVEKRTLAGAWQKLSTGQRNEAGDQMVGTQALARLHGIGRIDGDRPPAWAAPWDRNTQGFLPVSADPEGGAAVQASMRRAPARPVRPTYRRSSLMD